MESEKKLKARDKLVSKACTWEECKKGRHGLTGKAKDRARSRYIESEKDLESAAAEYQKAE
jgi:hypothetical protein